MTEILQPDEQSSNSPKPDGGGLQRPSVNNREDDKQRKTSSKIPNAEECLSAIAQLPGLIALKVLTTAQGNAIRSAFGDILKQHNRTDAGRDQQKVPDDSVLELIRKNPEMLSMLEPLLTDEQVRMVMKEAKDGSDE